MFAVFSSVERGRRQKEEAREEQMRERGREGGNTTDCMRSRHRGAGAREESFNHCDMVSREIARYLLSSAVW